MEPDITLGKLAGYLSTFKWYKNLHPEELLELAEFILANRNISFKEVE